MTQVEQGQSDWMYDQPPSDRLDEIATKYPTGAHEPGAQVFHMAMNTRVAPFDNMKVRQAMNYATDRNAMIKVCGGPQVATATCQILPPDFPGYEPYCPYTNRPGRRQVDGPRHGQGPAADRSVGHQGPEDLGDLDARRGQSRRSACTSCRLQPARLRRRHQGAERGRRVPLRPGLEQQGPDQLHDLVPGLPVRRGLVSTWWSAATDSTPTAPPAPTCRSSAIPTSRP